MYFGRILNFVSKDDATTQLCFAVLVWEFSYRQRTWRAKEAPVYCSKKTFPKICSCKITYKTWIFSFCIFALKLFSYAIPWKIYSSRVSPLAAKKFGSIRTSLLSWYSFAIPRLTIFHIFACAKWNKLRASSSKTAMPNCWKWQFEWSIKGGLHKRISNLFCRVPRKN